MAKSFNFNICETQQDLTNLLSQESCEKTREKIVALYLIKVGQVKSMQDLSQTIGKSQSTLQRWFQTYKIQGINGFLESCKG